MPTLTITLTAGGQTAGRVKTISAAHVTRFLDAYRALLGQVPDGAPDPVTGEQPMRDMTDDETVERWADGLIAGTRANVRRQQQAATSEAAAAAVDEIEIA